MPVKIVISGTGTDVGKTWVAQALTRALRARGLRCTAVKPIESGGGADARALAEACEWNPSDIPYCLPDPVAPHLAAERVGVRIDLETALAWIDKTGQGADLLLIELPGGLLSPLSCQHTNADLMQRIRPDRWIAVAPDRLGVLHDLTALLMCARTLRLDAPVVVLSEPEQPDASTGTNAASLRDCGICEVAARFDRGLGGPRERAEALAALIRWLGLT